ncbi:MAG: hypothetical protein KH972_07400 [Peptostreptococcaceae bacterium]|nr:hypothetical protein [Peptostreptococcaceae bacterium]
MAIKEEKKQEETVVKNTNTEEEKTYCYIGPNLPDGTLKKNSLIIGTKASIKEKYKDEIEKYPQLERLMVTVESLSEAKTKIATEGNILNKYFNDITSVIQNKAQ